jgi:hypothetical protein
LIKFHTKTRVYVKRPSNFKEGGMKGAAAWANQQGRSPSAAAEYVCAIPSGTEVRKEKDSDVSTRALESSGVMLVPHDVKEAFVKELKTEMDKQSGLARAEEARRNAVAKAEENRIKALHAAWKSTERGFKPNFIDFVKAEKANWKAAGATEADMEEMVRCLAVIAQEEGVKVVGSGRKHKRDEGGAGPAQQ